MKILFVTEGRVDAGSVQALANYIRVGDKFGHTVAVYGDANPHLPELRFSNDPRSFDYVVFIFESSLNWLSGLRVAHLLTIVPRSRRVILDADGMYNNLVVVDDYDRNHANEHERQLWIAACEALADRILQPTLRPDRSLAEPLLFYGYDSGVGTAQTYQHNKCIDIMHVGHNWWRWREISERLLPAIEQIRDRLGEICFVGLWWDAPPPWAATIGQDKAFAADPQRFRELRIRILPAVPYRNVVPTMSSARINIMTQRPLFQSLGLVTSKYFEIFSADTLPLVMIEPEHAERIYGYSGRELTLTGDIAAKLHDVFEYPEKYQNAAQAVRRHLAEHHSYARRLHELLARLDVSQSITKAG